MPLKSRLTRSVSPVAPSEETSTARVSAEVSPRRRGLTPSPESNTTPPQLDAVDQAVNDLANAVSGTDDAFDAEDDVQTGVSEAPKVEEPPAPTTEAAPEPPPQPRRRGRPARPALPDGELPDDIPALQAMLSALATEIKTARKEYEAHVRPMVEQYKAVSARVADLLPGRI